MSSVVHINSCGTALWPEHFKTADGAFTEEEKLLGRAKPV